MTTDLVRLSCQEEVEISSPPAAEVDDGTRKKTASSLAAFGNRRLPQGASEGQILQHNAWDNVEWEQEQEMEAQLIVGKQLEQQSLTEEQRRDFNDRANEHWNDFYEKNQNRFFKDRHWLNVEFPELYRRINDAPTTEGINVFEIGCGAGMLIRYNAFQCKVILTRIR